MNIVDFLFFSFFYDIEVFDFLDGPRGAREALGGRLGRVLGGVLGGSWAVLERSWSDIFSSSISDRFVDGF